MGGRHGGWWVVDTEDGGCVDYGALEYPGGSRAVVISFFI